MSETTPIVPAATTEAGELDLSITDVTTWTDTAGVEKKTNMEDIGAREGLGDGVTLTEDFKIDPTNAEDRSVSIGIVKRFEL